MLRYIMEINKNTEIRHLPANILEVLAQTLNDSWQRVMETIPQELLDNNEIDFVNNSSKYSPHQINLVQEHCMVHKIKFPALILFEEWGSSGKIRPTIGHLVEILSKLKIFVAIDYLLTETCPVRPLEGPAAPLDLTSFEDEPSTQIVSNYGDNRNNSDDNNKGYSNQIKVQLPKVHNSVLPSKQLDVVSRNPQTRTTNPVSADILPIQNSVISEDLLGPIPNIFELNSNISISSTKSNANNEVKQTNDRNLSGNLLPNFYELMKSESMNSNSLPDFEELCKSNTHDTNDNVTNGYGEINIPYFDIQSATDNFNDRKFKFFLAWRQKFELEIAMAKREKALGENKKLTGREMFLRDTTQAGESIEKVKIDESIYLLNFDDLDLDPDTEDEDYNSDNDDSS